MGNCVSRAFIATMLATLSGWGMVCDAIAQESRPDYRRPDYGARGVGTADWVFVPRLDSVFQRPRPDYDPLGIRLGAFILSPELALRGGYDSNVFAEENDTNDDFFGVASPAFRLQSDWSNHLLGVEGAVDLTKYTDETSEDAVEGRGTVFGRLDITGDDALFGSAGYRRQVQSRGDPEDTGGEQTEYNQWVGRVGYTHQFSRLNLRVDATPQRYDYLDSQDQDRDRNELELGTRLTYALSPRFTPFIEIGYDISDFDDSVDDNGIDRDQQQYSASLGGRVLITELLLGELSVGVLHTDFDDPTLDSSTTPAVSGDLIWNPTTLTSVIATAFRTESSTTQVGASGRVDTGITLRLEHELLENLLVYGQAGYTNNDFRQSSRTDNRIDAGLGGEFLLNRNLSFFAQYRFENRDSDAPGRDFTRNIAIIGARLQY